MTTPIRKITKVEAAHQALQVFAESVIDGGHGFYGDARPRLRPEPARREGQLQSAPCARCKL
jgi:hypothetical protein